MPTLEANIQQIKERIMEDRCSVKNLQYTQELIRSCSETLAVVLSKSKRIVQAEVIYKPDQRKFKKSKFSVVILGIDDLWVADLLIMAKFSDENDGYICIHRYTNII